MDKAPSRSVPGRAAPSRWVRTALVCLIAVGIGCGSPEDRFEEPPIADGEPTRAQLEGKRLYDYYCSLCHGETGNGDGFNSFNLDPRPAPFAVNAFVSNATNADLAAVIGLGGRSVGKSVLMPA